MPPTSHSGSSLYTVLLVEDRPDTRIGAEAAIAALDGVHVDPASSVPEARRLASGSFYHLALVDLDLNEARYGEDGRAFIAELASARPACDIVLFTGHPTGAAYRRAFFSVLDPVVPLLRGALAKDLHLANIDHVVAALRDQWRRSGVRIDALSARTAEVRKRVSPREVRPWGAHLTVTEQELGFVLWSMFGSDDPTSIGRDRDTRDLVASYDVQLVPEKIDRGASAVYRARVDMTFTSGQTAHGVPCIVKIGHRLDIAEEVSRYRRFVELGVGGRHRVELLRHSLGDTIGGICYSLGRGDYPSGSSLDDAPHTMKSLVERRTRNDDETVEFDSPRLDKAITSIFSAEVKQWYDLRFGAVALVEWFRTERDFELSDALEAILHYCQAHLRGLGGQLVGGGDEISFDEHGKRHYRLLRLDDGQIAALWRRTTSTCLVHGDLHVGNVLVAPDGEAALIDYRCAGAGPRVLDFVALETSLRLIDPVVPYRAPADDQARRAVVRKLVNDVAWDAIFWSAEPLSWSSFDSQIAPSAEDVAGALTRQRPGVEPPRWAVEAGLIQWLARANFPDLDASEYAATTLMYWLWLFSRPEVLPGKRDYFGKLRLLLGISGFLHYLDASSGR